MAATFSLTGLRLTRGVDEREPVVSVTSTSGLAPGIRLFVDKEMLSVVSLGPDGVRCLRGVDGTRATHHDSGAIGVFGAADLFFTYDPQGAPGEVVLVYPHINIRTGDAWFPQGDEAPAGKAYRWWQKAEITYSQGALGILRVTFTPASIA